MNFIKPYVQKIEARFLIKIWPRSYLRAVQYRRHQRQKLTPEEVPGWLLMLWQELNRRRFLSTMSPPSFKLTRARKYLGAYRGFRDGSSGVIMISQEAFYFSTDSLFLDILLHEMAHQYCAEVLGLHRDLHGKIWQFVARSCGAKPRLRRNR